MAIKLIALDLDGTTLNSKKELTPATQSALEEAIDRGIYVVIATGRVLSALPENVLKVDGIQYALTSNGANIIDLKTRKSVYRNLIASSAIEEIVELLSHYDFMIEVFVDGHAYVDQKIYDNLDAVGLGISHTDYIRETREPVEGLLDFMLRHKAVIENINVNFGNQTDRAMMREVLAKLQNVTLTTSFDHNLELGGATTSKAAAVKHLCELLGVDEKDVMACGDSPNDASMLMAAGLPIAMGNGKDEIKDIAKYVTGTNDEDGVAQAVHKFVLSS